MKYLPKSVIALFLLPLLVGLACQLGGAPQLPNVDLDAAATTAANAAATAQAAAQNLDVEGLAATAESVAATAEALSGTVVAQGGDLAGTAEAAATLIPPVTVDVSSIRDKIGNLQPDENGNYTLVITEDELNNAIVIGEQSEAAGQGSIENTAVNFSNGRIVLSGSVTTPVNAQMMVIFLPVIEAGVLQFEVEGATVGNINVPAYLLANAEGKLNTTLGVAISQLPNNVTLTSVTVTETDMTIIGTRN